MSIVVYCLALNANDEVIPVTFSYDDNQMTEALARCQELRAAGYEHVVMSTQLDNQVGTQDAGGVVVDGKLPDGSDYEWSKAHRAGAKAQKEIISK